jgi:hypothetical protein
MAALRRSSILDRRIEQTSFTQLRISFLAFLILGFAARSEAKPDEYVVRIAHEVEGGTACVLVLPTGTFHYEKGDRDNTRVYEGKLSTGQLSAVENDLQGISAISQQEIEEPLTNASWDLLDIHQFHDGNPQEVLFRSAESQQAFKKSLGPLLQWMDGLPKLPHRELSEDAGKNNCLPRRALVLRKRSEVERQPPLSRTPLAGRRMAPINPSAASPNPVQSAEPLFQMQLLEKKSSGTQQECALVASDGRYRVESRYQKVGRKNIEDRLVEDQITTEELQDFTKILDTPELAAIRHHPPPDRMPLNIRGTVLELYISRASGVQELVLTDNTHRNTFFYAGDSDVSRAAPLLKFVREHFESKTLSGTNADLNGCTQLNAPTN